MFIENSVRKDGCGWIEVICGSMFSGKTEELIRRLKRAQIAKQKVEIFKPSVDTRYHNTDIVTHDNRSIPSTPVPYASSILLLAGDIDVVGIDEAQFFDDELPHVCNTLANNGVRVIIAGLDMDFSGKPFGPMPHLMCIAEYVTKVHAVCMRTGDIANYSFRKNEDQSVVSLGEKDIYEALSRKAYVQAQKDLKEKKIALEKNKK